MFRYISLALVLAIAALPAMASPERFAPGAISLDDQITLTPAFSPDGKTAYFPQSACSKIGPCPQTLHVSRQVAGKWSKAERVKLPQEGRVDWPSVSPDGRYLYFSWSAQRSRYAALDVDEDFDLFRLDLNSSHAVPEPLDMSNINRPRAGAIKRLRYFHNETAPVLTAAGDLYFWTERSDAIGERDIFLAPSNGKGGFETARPLPAPINSTGRDNQAWVSPEGGLMFVTYNERGGEGSDDIFVSRKIDGEWSEPTPLGPKINSRWSDISARFTPDKSEIVFTSTRPFEGQASGLLQVWSVVTDDLIKAGTLTKADLSR